MVLWSDYLFVKISTVKKHDYISCTQEVQFRPDSLFARVLSLLGLPLVPLPLIQGDVLVLLGREGFKDVSEHPRADGFVVGADGEALAFLDQHGLQEAQIHSGAKRYFS